MIYTWTENNTSKILRIFESFNKARAIIIPSILQRRSRLWVDSLDSPSAVLWRLKVLNVLVGDADCPAANELVHMLEPPQVLIAPGPHWSSLVQKTWGPHIETLCRTKFSPDSLTIKHLSELSDKCPKGYEIERMSLETIKTLDKRVHSYIPMYFGGSVDFFEKGIGFCVKDRGKVVSSATTFSPFIDEFETEVNTVNDSRYRGRGFATSVAAALLMYALEHNIVPHWDAENDISGKIAFKLGYSNPEPYKSLYIKQL